MQCSCINSMLFSTKSFNCYSIEIGRSLFDQNVKLLLYNYSVPIEYFYTPSMKNNAKLYPFELNSSIKAYSLGLFWQCGHKASPSIVFIFKLLVFLHCIQYCLLYFNVTFNLWSLGTVLIGRCARFQFRKV